MICRYLMTQYEDAIFFSELVTATDKIKPGTSKIGKEKGSFLSKWVLILINKYSL